MPLLFTRNSQVATRNFHLSFDGYIKSSFSPTSPFFFSASTTASYFGSLYALAAQRKTLAASAVLAATICWPSHCFSPDAYGDSQSSAARRLRPSSVL